MTRLINRFLISLSLFAIVLLTACGDGSVSTGNPNPSQPPASSNKQPVEQAGQLALAALKESDMEKLAGLAHPDKGIRFSPYAYVDKERDLVFRPEQIRKLLQDRTVYEWGVFDGSGEPIKLTFGDYYRRFIFDLDFTKPQSSAVNQTLGTGNTKSNLTEVYDPARHAYIDYHFDGIDPKYGGMDWRSLRLVFEKSQDGSWVLVGIIHDQWTI